MAQDVFISYSHKDKSIAEAVCASLENAGMRCWIAPRDIAPGLDWPTAITRAIRAGRVMVLIFSASSNASKDVSRELILASNNDLTIIPFRIDDTPPEPGKEYYLARTHWLEAMNPPTQEQINALVGAIKIFLPDQGMAAPVQPAPQETAVRTLTTAPVRVEPVMPEPQVQAAPQETITPLPETAPPEAEPVSLEAEPQPAPQETITPLPETAFPGAEPVSLEAEPQPAPQETITPLPEIAPPVAEPVSLEAEPQPAPLESLAPAPEASFLLEKPVRQTLLKAMQSLQRNRIWIGGALLILALVGGGVLVARSLGTLPKATHPTASPTQTRMQTTTHATAMVPTATDTPLATWITGFANPILAAIADRPPDFQDDFSQLSPEWSIDSGELKINNGMLTIKVDPNLGSNGVKVTNPGMRSNNFVLQLDANLQELSPCGENNAHDQLDIDWRESSQGGMIFSLFRCPQVLGGLKYCSASNCTNLQEGKPSVGITQLVTIMIISRGTEYGIYMNNLPFFHLKDVDRESGQNITLILSSVDPQSTATLEIDNLKMWDLDAFSNLP